MFFVFNCACVKYGFTYTLSNTGNLMLILNPDNTFEHICVYGDGFIKLFYNAIKKMKEYREVSC